MPLNHSQATATVTVAGLALFRLIGPDGAKQCEIGILQCDNHTLELRIEEIHLEPDGVTPLRSRVIAPEFDLNKDIFIRVNDPLEKGVIAYKPDQPGVQPPTKNQKFDDVEDFGWIVDFTSRDFNDGPIILEPDPANTTSPKTFKPKIYFTDGKLYTAAITPDSFARELIGNPEDRVFIGQIGFKAGLDIKCGDDDKSGIELGNEGRPFQFLPTNPYQNKPRVRYEVSIENVCPYSAEMMAAGSDFHLYYDAITTDDHKRFDLRKVVPNGGDPNKALLEPNDNFSLDGTPLACNPVGG